MDFEETRSSDRCVRNDRARIFQQELYKSNFPIDQINLLWYTYIDIFDTYLNNKPNYCLGDNQ